MQQNRLAVLLALVDEVFVVANVLELMMEDKTFRATPFTLETATLSAGRCQDLVSMLASMEHPGDRE